MSKISKYILITMMSISIVVQVFCINKYNKAKNVIVYNTQNSLHNHKTLKELNEELNCLKEKNILSANKNDDKWYIKVKIQGNKEELLRELLKLKKYDISDYCISRSEAENSIVVEISSK